MHDFPPIFYATIRWIDRFTDAFGKLVSLAMLWLVITISYECIARYAFNAPTIWVMEASYMANGGAFMLGCAYALHKGAHVRTDIFWENYTERRKGIIDLTSYLLLFYPALITFFVISVDDVMYSISIGERSEMSPWRATIEPTRAHHRRPQRVKSCSLKRPVTRSTSLSEKRLRRLQRASTSGSGESRPGRTVSESSPPIAARSASTSSGGQMWWSNQISRPR